MEELKPLTIEELKKDLTITLKRFGEYNYDDDHFDVCDWYPFAERGRAMNMEDFSKLILEFAAFGDREYKYAGGLVEEVYAPIHEKDPNLVDKLFEIPGMDQFSF